MSAAIMLRALSGDQSIAASVAENVARLSGAAGRELGGALLGLPYWRRPDFVIGPADRPYIRRWHLQRTRDQGCVYLHQILRSDDDRALHDHRGATLSVILLGGYDEVMPAPGGHPAHGPFVTVTRRAGDVIFRAAEDAHRLVLPEGGECWSLFVTGPEAREWGFHCPQGWRPHHQFVHPDDPGLIGPGCA